MASFLLLTTKQTSITVTMDAIAIGSCRPRLLFFMTADAAVMKCGHFFSWNMALAAVGAAWRDIVFLMAADALEVEHFPG